MKNEQYYYIANYRKINVKDIVQYESPVAHKYDKINLNGSKSSIRKFFYDYLVYDYSNITNITFMKNKYKTRSK
jgi:hypothetical protein